MSKINTADVVIIGAGLIGSTLAFRLAQEGQQVIVLERAKPNQEASSAAAGMLTAQTHLIKMDAIAELCLASRTLYPDFLNEVQEASGMDVNYFSQGTLNVAFGEKEFQELEKSFSLQKTLNLPVEKVSAEQACKMGAGLDPTLLGGLYFPCDHWVDNQTLAEASVEAAQAAGAKFFFGEKVNKAELKEQCVVRVSTSRQDFSAAHFVLAAGCWSGQIAKIFGLRLPVSPSRGQLMEFHTEVDLSCTVWCGHLYLVPRREGCLLVGTTVEDVGFDKSVTVGGLHAILEGTLQFAPWIHKAGFRRAWTGLRPDTSDHWPVLGRGKISNLIFATGHFRNGILLAPITAKILTEEILGGSPSHSLMPFSPDRFAC